MKIKKQVSSKTIAVVFGVFVLLFALGFYVVAWEEPDTAPPGGNVYAPLNTGSSDQYKVGRLGAYTNDTDLNYGFIVGAAGMAKGIKATGDSWFDGNINATGQICDSIGCILWSQSGSDVYYNSGNVGIGVANPGAKLEIAGGYIVPAGGYGLNWRDNIWGGGGDDAWIRYYQESGENTKLQIGINNDADDDIEFYQAGAARMTIYNGNVGIGTANPTEKLSVNGVLDMMNHKISNVSEIDPVFGIQGKKYVSYMTDMVGQKIEVVGEAELEGDELVIDFEKQEEGSDLWLFWQTVARETIIPFVSSQSDAELYSYIDGSEFIIKLRNGEQNAKFSYRLIGTRLDHVNSTDNLYDDQSVEYFIDIDALRK